MTSKTSEHWAVAVHHSQAATAEAVRALALSGLDMARWSVIAKISAEEDALGFYTSGVRFQIWGARRRDWQCLWTTLLGSAFFFVPRIGPVVVMGPLVGVVVDVLDSLAGRGTTGALAAVFASLGIEKDRAREYEQAIAEGRSLMFANGDREFIERANATLVAHGSAPLTPSVVITTARAPVALQL